MPDPRARLHAARRIEQERLALRKVERAAICGCLTCHDEDRGQELDVLIRHSEMRIQELGELWCQRTERPPEFSRTEQPHRGMMRT